MAITKALMYARVSSSTSTGTGVYKKARVAATRLNFYGPKHLLKVNGTGRTGNFDRTTWVVTDRGRGQGKTLSVDVFGFTPANGQEIILGGGSFSNRLFRGTIVRVRQVRNRLHDGRVVYRLSCVDWTYQLGNLKVTGRYQSTSATAVAQSLMTLFAPAGFTVAHVQTGLAELDDIQFTMQTLPSALQQLCQRIGGAFYIDAEKDLHLYVGTDPTGVAPEALTDSNKHVRSGITYEADIEDLRNRCLVEGMGSTVTSEVIAGFTSIPMQDSSMFESTGGEAKLEAQRITYTGVATQADSGCVTAGVSGGSPGALGAVQSAGALATYVSGNLSVGAYQYAYSFVNALGETDLSPLVGVTIVDVDRPLSTPSFVVGTGGSLTANGIYIYYCTFVTSAGESGWGGPWMPGQLPPTFNKWTLNGIPTSADGRVTSRRIYRTNNLGGDTRLVATIGDNVTTTLVDSASDASIAANTPLPSFTGTAGSGKADLTSIAIGPLGTTSRKIYRTAVNASALKLLTTIADNVTTSALDNSADGSLGAPATGSTLGAAAGQTTLRLSDLSVVPDGGWLRAGSQVIHYDARSATSGAGDVTGIPASGTGAITAQIPAGSAVTVEPHVTGVPASGAGAVVETIAIGSSINLLVRADDTTSQGTYGIREDFAQDRRLSAGGASELASARLALLKDPRVTIAGMASTDPKLASGRPVTVSFSTWGLTATVTVQSVTIKPTADRPQPMLEATLASRSLDDLYAQLRDIREHLSR